jgi:hypothetical protein
MKEFLDSSDIDVVLRLAKRVVCPWVVSRDTLSLLSNNWLLLPLGLRYTAQV